MAVVTWKKLREHLEIACVGGRPTSYAVRRYGDFSQVGPKYEVVDVGDDICWVTKATDMTESTARQYVEKLLAGAM